ncbi:hypothetical protein SDC9_123682 [bioreactor metagenome]|uniref:Uncharacterized protein n=1 Tax=bioreactor metagenome TaxID=1076179 RepID=A0A645CIC3_9ZZZZ|nr:hypothetical protein [Oscillospiraceae bacterium]
MGKLGDKLSGIMGIPDVPVSHLNSMSSVLAKRISNAVRYQLGKGATKEIGNAIKYYFSQTATSIWKTIIKTLLVEGARDTTIENIIDATGLESKAQDEIRRAFSGKQQNMVNYYELQLPSARYSFNINRHISLHSINEKVCFSLRICRRKHNQSKKNFKKAIRL